MPSRRAARATPRGSVEHCVKLRGASILAPRRSSASTHCSPARYSMRDARTTVQVRKDAQAQASSSALRRRKPELGGSSGREGGAAPAAGLHECRRRATPEGPGLNGQCERAHTGAVTSVIRSGGWGLGGERRRPGGAAPATEHALAAGDVPHSWTHWPRTSTSVVVAPSLVGRTLG